MKGGILVSKQIIKSSGRLPSLSKRRSGQPLLLPGERLDAMLEVHLLQLVLLYLTLELGREELEVDQTEKILDSDSGEKYLFITLISLSCSRSWPGSEG